MKQNDLKGIVVILVIVLAFGIHMKLSLDKNNEIRDEFCKSNGFAGHNHELIPQIFYCFDDDRKVFMASYLGKYTLFDPTTSCDTPQFKESKICEFFFYPEVSCNIPRFKFNEQCT